MPRGRPAKGPKIVEGLDGSEEAKKRLEVVLETIAGKKNVGEACKTLGIERSAFHKLRSQVLQTALSDLEPKPRGRPPESTPESYVFCDVYCAPPTGNQPCGNARLKSCHVMHPPEIDGNWASAFSLSFNQTGDLSVLASAESVVSGGLTSMGAPRGTPRLIILPWRNHWGGIAIGARIDTSWAAWRARCMRAASSR